MKMTLEWFEKEINAVEEKMFVTNSIHLQEKWTDLKQELCSVLNVKVKTALVRSRFLSIKDMDGPTSCFFNLERKAEKKNIMYRLKDNNGHYTEDPIEMRQIAVDFYSDLYAMDNTDELNRDELLKDLPCISSEHKEALETEISFEELTAAVMSLSLGRSPGINGLPTEFYRTFWKIIGSDYFEVVKDCIYKGILPKSCQRAVLALLPKKGDLTMLKNWRPVALLCVDYKILSKCIANRLNKVLCEIIHKDQSYCVKGRSITDNLHLMKDLIDYAQYNNHNIGILSLDQEKAFDRVDHQFLFKTLQSFGFGKNICLVIQLLYNDATCMIGIAGGLSVPIKVRRGIRQGCPLSGQFYSLAIEPFLCKLRNGLTGLQINSAVSQYSIKVTA